MTKRSLLSRCPSYYCTNHFPTS